MSVTVAAPARLHLGLIRPTAVNSGERRFGGVGLMLNAPAVRVRVEHSAEWVSEGPHAGRALEAARAVAGGTGPLRVTVEDAPPAHIGLGSGTQLDLAAGRAAATLLRRDIPTPALARILGRGRRSAVGVHGFDRGGLIVEAGKPNAEELGTLVGAFSLPEPWRVVLLLPTVADAAGTWHGERERSAMDRLGASEPPPGAADAMCRVVLLEMLPAALAGDARGFGEAVFAYNRLAGQMFAAEQGGTYASPEVAGCVEWARAAGARGVGQSSWGPTVFAVVGSAEEAEWLARRCSESGPAGRVALVTGVAAPSGHAAEGYPRV